jgi:hypothetical protein
MARVAKILLVLALLAAFTAPAWAQVVLVPGAPPGPVLAPAPPGVVPGWTPVPGSPMVLYAPNCSGGLYKHKNRYFYNSGGYWFQAKHPNGPWAPVLGKLPPELRAMQQPCF